MCLEYVLKVDWDDGLGLRDLLLALLLVLEFKLTPTLTLNLNITQFLILVVTPNLDLAF